VALHDLLGLGRSLADRTAGAGALLAALIAVGGSEWRARKATRTMLASEVRLYVDLLIITRGVLKESEPWFLGKNGKGLQRDLRDLTVVFPPIVYPVAAAGAMGLLSRPRAAAVVDFYGTIERLNFVARGVTNEPAEKVLPLHYSILFNLTEQGCRTGLPLLAKFPFDKRDAEFRAKIAEWDAARPPEC
jgi:hypothetical protein